MPHNRGDGARVHSRRSSGSRPTRRPPATAPQGDARAPRQQRVALPAARRGGRRRRARRSPASTATPTRRARRCAARCATATACRPSGSRSATAPATCCSRWARRCSSRAPSSSTRWPSFSVYPQLEAASGARGIRVPLDGDERHDLDAMAREITVATRLVIVCNPNNPTSTALPLAQIAAFVERVPSQRLRADRRGLLRVQPARRPRRLDRAARPPPQPRAAAHLLEGLRALRAARRLCAVRLARAAGRARAGPPAVLPQRRPRRPPRSRRSSTRTRSRAASSGPRSRACRWSTGCASSGSQPATSQANFCWFDLGEGRDEAADRRRAGRARACSCAPAARSASDGALRVSFGTPAENDRFLEVLATLL